MKTLIASLIMLIAASAIGQEQERNTVHLTKLEIGKRDNETFARGDSTLTVYIDTLIMADRSSIRFVGKKAVNLVVKHADIGKGASIFGNDGKNNGTDFDIDIRFDELGSLFVLAGGMDANNGFRTHPNGNGGDVTLRYDEAGIAPQSENRRDRHYVAIDTRAGGYRNNPQSEIRNIYGRINPSIIGRPLAALPQGMIYSGTPGRGGKVVIEAIGQETDR